MPHSQPTGPGQVEDGPPGAVFHPVRCADTNSPVVPASDHQITDARRIAVGEVDLPIGSGAGEAVILSALVEPADQLPRRGQHDRVQALVAVVLPGVENIVEGGRGVADVDASPVEVEAERFGPALAKREGGGGLSRVGEPVQFGEPDRSVGVCDVAKHPAGTDRSQLLIITDRPNTATTADDELNGSVQGEGVGHPGFVDDHQRGPVDTVGVQPTPTSPSAGRVHGSEAEAEVDHAFGDGAGALAVASAKPGEKIKIANG